MIESDTIKLLRECDLGIKMGVSAIEEVVESVKNEEFKCLLLECRNKHMALKNEIVTLLHWFDTKQQKLCVLLFGSLICSIG